MILVDMSQVMVSNLMVQLGNHQNAPLDENMLRHMFLNTLRKNRKKFSKQYGEIVLCLDDRKSWRYNTFRYYKSTRKSDREKSDLDWGYVFDIFSKISTEIDENFPYKVLKVPEAEADDIIGTIVSTETDKEFLILSGDKDFIQLQKYGNVRQYNPTLDKWITHDDPEQYLVEHIYKGDAGDGIPNVMTEDSFFATKQRGERQKPITKKRMEEMANTNDSTLIRRINRNATLIDLENTPQKIKDECMRQFHLPPKKNGRMIRAYLTEHRLRDLLKNIAEF